MKDKQIFEAMNGIRGLAALIVVVDHCATIGWFKGHLADKFVDYGPLAVDLFFVMSGFVIAHAYRERLSRGMTTKTFLLARLIRLYPLYILGIGIGCLTPLISILHNGRLVDAQVAAVTSIPFASAMLPNPVAANASQMLYPLNGPAWSLFFELIINIIYASTWKWWTKGNLLVLMGAAAAALLWNRDFSGGWNWVTLLVGFSRISYSFPAGVFIFLLYRDGVRISPKYAPIVLVAVGAVSLLPNFVSKAFAVIAVFPILVAIAAQMNFSGALASICGKLGAASYAVYAIHDPLLLLTNNTISKFSYGHDHALLGTVFVCTSIPVCLIIDGAFDQPIRSFLVDKFYRDRLRERSQVGSARSE